MGTTSKESVKRKVFPKGQIVIPVALRKKYHIDIEDHVDVIPKSDGILLKPVPKQEEKIHDRLIVWNVSEIRKREAKA